MKIQPLKCRFCATPLTTTMCDLGMSPISNAFVEPAQAQAMEPFFPLHALVCSNCKLVQLGEFEAREAIFDDDYAYFSSVSSSWLDHAKRYVHMMIDRFGYGADAQVVEIASNDGYLLQYFAECGVPVLGIEPTANTAAVAMKKGIDCRVEFFGVDCATQLAAEGRHADLILGNNVLAHVPDINDFVGGLPVLLKASGVVTFEFPHLLNLIRLGQFDTVYHEHFSYLSLLSVQRILAHHGLRVFDVEQIPTHGGSLRVFACHTEGAPHTQSDRVEALLKEERDAGLEDMATYEAFGQTVQRIKRELLKFLIEAQENGQRVAGYGAPAKGNTLLNYCGVREDLLEFTVDRSPRKQNTLLPGVRIPVLSPAAIDERKPDFVLILPWNLKDEICEQMKHIRDWGGRFVVPIPELRVLE